MSDKVLNLPSYYLTRQTSGGTLLLYPRAQIDGAGVQRYRPDESDGAHEVNGWTFEVVEPAGVAWVFEGIYLVADRPLDRLRRTRPGAPIRDGWGKRSAVVGSDEGPVAPELQRAYNGAPDRPDSLDVDHYSEHEAPHACWRCRVFAATYAPRRVPGEPVVEVQSFDKWAELPGGEDPDPDRKWVVTEPGYLTIYGEHTRHMWPGKMPGLRDAVVDALRAHPHVREVKVWNHKPTEVSIEVAIPFDEPRSTSRQVKATPRARTKMRTVHEPVYGYTESIRDVRVPDDLQAPSKAEAIAGWDEAVQRQVDRFLPFGRDLAVCSRCDGSGLVVTRGGQ